MQSSVQENLALMAAVASAAPGWVSAVAARRSSDHARHALEASSESVRRTALRDVSSLAATVVSEAKSVELRAYELDLIGRSHRARGLDQIRQHFEKQANESIAHAAPFVGGARSLVSAPVDEIERVYTRMAERMQVRSSARAELDRVLTKYAPRRAQ